MGKLSKDKEELLAELDAIITLVERSGNWTDMFDNISISISPMELLLSLLRRCGIGYDEIVDFLSQYIVKVIPILEITVKGLLLAKLKANIDCNLDPRIPFQYREEIGGITTAPLSWTTGQNANYSGDRGIEIDLSTIDNEGLLNISPMSERSHYKYFGTKCYYTVGDNQDKFYLYEEAIKYALDKGIDESQIHKYSEIDDIHELVRAKDLNAFLWFVLHKARFISSQDLTTVLQNTNGKCVLDTIETNTSNYIGVGTSLIQDDFSVMGLCIKNTPSYSNPFDVKENATSHVSNEKPTDNDVAQSIIKQQSQINGYNCLIVPTTNVWNGVNWYVDRTRFFDFWNKKEREYDKEFALFRLCMKTINGRVTDKLQFTIKPAPNMLIPSIGIKYEKEQVDSEKTISRLRYTGDSPLSFHRLTFNANGEKDTWGKYSVVVGNKIENSDNTDNIYNEYQLIKPSSTNEELTNVKLKVNKTTREYEIEVEGNGDKRCALYECYPGFTVYEFNYDFIMGIQLFDASVITAQLIEGLTNIRLGLTYSTTSTDYQMRISEIVKKIVNTNGYEATDCFYSFSNSEYDDMMNESELKRASLYPFNDSRFRAMDVSNEDVYGILNEFDSKATLEENISVINRAITQASAAIIQEALPEDKYNLQLDFITKAIEMLTTIFVESLLSPKMLLVLLINQKMMGEDDGDWSIEGILKQFKNIIMSLIEQIRDMILQKLLDFIMDKIQELIAAAMNLLLMEQVEYYSRLISQLLRACRFSLGKNPDLPSTLDYVDYADIEPNDKPITNEC